MEFISVVWLSPNIFFKGIWPAFTHNLAVVDSGYIYANVLCKLFMFLEIAS